MKVSKILGIIFSVIVFMVLCLIGYLGGYNSVEIKENENQAYWMNGKSFEGSIQSEKFGLLFKEIEEEIQKLEVRPVLVAYYEGEPTKENGFQTKAYVGFLLEDSIKISQDFSLKKVQFSSSVYGYKKSHHAVSRIPTNLKDFAEDEGKELDPSKCIEFYISERELAMEFAYLESSN